MTNEIDAKTLKKWMTDKKDFELIDVRMPFEYKFKHIEGSKLIPLKEIFARLSELDKTKPVVFICQSGGRSCMACEIASKEGYKTYNLSGGLMNWSD